MKHLKALALAMLLCQTMVPATSPKDIFGAIDQNDLAAVKKFIEADKNVLTSLSAPIDSNTIKKYKASMPPLFYALRQSDYSPLDDYDIAKRPVRNFLDNAERVKIIQYLITQGAPLYWDEKRPKEVILHYSAITFCFAPENFAQRIVSIKQQENAHNVIAAILAYDKSPQQMSLSISKEGTKLWVIPVIFLALSASPINLANKPILNFIIDQDPSQINSTVPFVKKIVIYGRDMVPLLDLWAFASLRMSEGDINGFLGSNQIYGLNLLIDGFGKDIEAIQLWLLERDVSPFRMIPFAQKTNFDVLNPRLLKRKSVKRSDLEEGFSCWLGTVNTSLRQAEILRPEVFSKKVLGAIQKKYPDAAQQFANILNTKFKDGSYAFAQLGESGAFDPLFDLAGNKIERGYFEDVKKLIKEEGRIKQLDKKIEEIFESSKQLVYLSKELQALANSLKQLG